jgi:hypothetical protein
MSRYELFTMSTSGKLAVAKLAASKYAEWAEGLILMEIFTNDGSTSTPSSLLATLSFNFNSVTPSVATAYLSDGPVLTAGSSYWLGYRAGSPLSALALYRNSLGITVADRIDDNGVIHTGLSSAAAVELSAVPEPSTYAMALAGLACGGYSMWRRRKRA